MISTTSSYVFIIEIARQSFGFPSLSLTRGHLSEARNDVLSLLACPGLGLRRCLMSVWGMSECMKRSFNLILTTSP